MDHLRPRALRFTPLLLAAAALPLVLAGCSSFSDIDKHVEALMATTNDEMGGDNVTPGVQAWKLDQAAQDTPTAYSPTAKTLPTVNPPASELNFVPAAIDDADRVLNRLDSYNEVAPDAIRMNLRDALAYSIANSREYRFAEEEFVLDGLRLLVERHLWGPLFFDDVTASFDGTGDSGFFDTALNLVNEFRVTQRLPYGGTVSARALARATEELHGTILNDGAASADVILQADIPLLRGAGTVAQENLIQANRNMVYAGRSFERFRRQFLVDIASDFLDLVLLQRGLGNSQRQLDALKVVEERQTALYREGRVDRFDAARAENATVSSRDSLNNAQERYRLAVDRFKVRLGMPVKQALIIIDSGLSLPVPDVTIDDAVRLAMAYRLDLQNERDQLGDSKRALDNAENDLLPDLNLGGTFTMPTDDSESNVVDFRPGNSDFTASVTFGLPLDREVERINVRQAQINLERAARNYDEFRDNIAANVRASVRSMDAATFSLDIQERGIEIAQQGVDSIDAAPERADVEQTTRAINDLLAARDQRDSAYRDLQVAILEYLRDTGQLRVLPDGSLLPPNGMILPKPESGQPGTPNSSENDGAAPGNAPNPGDDGDFGVK